MTSTKTSCVSTAGRDDILDCMSDIMNIMFPASPRTLPALYAALDHPKQTVDDSVHLLSRAGQLRTSHDQTSGLLVWRIA
jgi:hypothetical protein